MVTALQRLMTIHDPAEITYNSTVIALVADHFEAEGSPAADVASIRRSSRLILRCGDTSGQELWSRLKKETPLHRRIFVSSKAPRDFLEDFAESERRRAEGDFVAAVESDRRNKVMLKSS